MKKIVLYDGEFEITLRELITSLAIVFLMVAFGFFIHSNIHNSILEKNEKYRKAPVTNSIELYNYVKKTGIGNTFTIFELKAVEPQSIPELSGEYLYIEKVKEHYTRHTRTVSSTDSKGKVTTKTETYYTWDRVWSEELESKEIIFNGDIYPIDKFNGYSYNSASLSDIGTDYLKENYYKIRGKYAYEDSDDRYYFVIVPTEMQGSAFVNLSNNEIQNEIVTLYLGTTPEELKDISIENTNSILVIFWFFWIFLTGGLVVIFYVIDNRWLEY